MKATHTGECQICGSRQMLPGGVLSKHGYTKKWGFFNGICTGAEHQPFELSKDRIAGAVAAMQLTITAVEREIEGLCNPGALVNAGNEAQVRVYGSYSGYIWTKCQIRVVTQTYGTGADAFTRHHPEYLEVKLHPSQIGETVEKWHRTTVYGEEAEQITLNQWVAWYNTKYAKHLERVNSQRRSWVQWQTARLKNWAPKPLTPRGSK